MLIYWLELNLRHQQTNKPGLRFDSRNRNSRKKNQQENKTQREIKRKGSKGEQEKNEYKGGLKGLQEERGRKVQIK